MERGESGLRPRLVGRLFRGRKTWSPASPTTAWSPAYIVDDVDYCIEQANDMVAGEGDFAEGGPQSNQTVDVTELDRHAYPQL